MGSSGSLLGLSVFVFCLSGYYHGYVLGLWFRFFGQSNNNNTNIFPSNDVISKLHLPTGLFDYKYLSTFVKSAMFFLGMANLFEVLLNY